MLKAAKRGAPTDPFWAGRKAQTTLFNVMEWERIEPFPSSRVTALMAAREKAAILHASTLLSSSALDMDDKIVASAYLDKANEMLSTRAQVDPVSFHVADAPRYRIKSTTKGGMPITKTWIFLTNTEGLVTGIIDETDLEEAAKESNPQRVQALFSDAKAACKPIIAKRREEVAKREEMARRFAETAARMQAEQEAEEREREAEEQKRYEVLVKREAERVAKERAEAQARLKATREAQQKQIKRKTVAQKRALSSICIPHRVLAGHWSAMGSSGDIGLRIDGRSGDTYEASLVLGKFARLLKGKVLVAQDGSVAVRFRSVDDGVSPEARGKFRHPSMRWMTAGNDVSMTLRAVGGNLVSVSGGRGFSTEWTFQVSKK